MNCKKWILSSLLSLFLTQSGFAQYAPGCEPPAYRLYQQTTSTARSPSTEAFKRIDEVGVDMFNGISTVNIPLFNLKGENMEHALGLSYYGGGVRVNETAGWAGLSWTLNGDYQITRSVNDMPDEYFNTNIGWYEGEQRDKGYMFTAHHQLNNANWNTTRLELLESFAAAYLWFGPNKSTTAANVIIDGAPDEFAFSLPNGVSGSFYRSHTALPGNPTGWKVKSKSDVPLEVSHEMYVQNWGIVGTPFNRIMLNNWYNGTYEDKSVPMINVITKFTIKTPDGYTFIFGGVDSALEVSRGFLNVESDYNGKFSHIRQQYSVNAWKLTKIVAPEGEEINFTYNRGKIQFHRTKDFVDGAAYGATSHVTMSLDYGLSMIYPVYLSTIETSRQRLIFKRSQAVEKWYNNIDYNYEGLYQPLGLPGGGTCSYSRIVNAYNNRGFSELAVENDRYSATYVKPFVGVGNVNENPDGSLPNYNQQLDSIILFDKLENRNVFGYKLQHSNNANQRRTLNGIYRFNFKDTKIADKYDFFYNDITDLPPLDDMNRDYWGFRANGLQDYRSCALNLITSGVSNWPDLTPVYSTVGLLSKINNPYGGSTEFEYESNQYKNKIKVNVGVDAASSSVGLENMPTANHVGPGARVKKITHKEFLGAPEVVKEYKYVANYPIGTASSGLLNFDNIIDRPMVLTCDASNDIAPLTNHSTLSHLQFTRQFKGGIVNYDEVTELNADGGYTVYKYTNANNPEYRDEFAAGYRQSNISGNKNFRLSSVDLDRGKIAEIRHYKSGNELVKTITNTYQNSPNRKNDFVRAVDNLTLGAPGESWCSQHGSNVPPNHRAWAYKIYTYKNPLIKTTEVDYSDDGTSLTKETDYTYDQYGNTTLITTLSSDGKTIRKATRYNSHPDYNTITPNQYNTAGIGIRNLMLNHGIKNYPVEVTVSEQSSGSGGAAGFPSYTSGELYLYKTDKPVLLSKAALGLTAGLEEGNLVNPGGYFPSGNDANGNFSKDSRYQWHESVIEYTNTPTLTSPKPRTIESRQKANTSMTWDYQGHFMSSKTVNADANDIAYSGFEGSYAGNNAYYKNAWLFDHTKVQTTTAAFTGEKALLVDATPNNTASGAFITTTSQHYGTKPYKVSFWAKLEPGAALYYTIGTNAGVALSAKREGINNWKYYEFESYVNTGQDVGIVLYRTSAFASSALIDELMFYPLNAQMESYSYHTGTGNITSMNSGNGHIIKYEYDNLGRLITQRDEKGNIIKKYNYKTHYEPIYETE